MQLRDSRWDVADEYERKYGEDPRPWLEDPSWMSDEISEEGETEEERQLYRTKLARKAALTPEEIEARVRVWEVVRPAHRAEVVRVPGSGVGMVLVLMSDMQGNVVIDRLDQLRRQKQGAQTRGRRGNGPVARRVTWGRRHPEPPRVPVYDYLVDPDWFATFQQQDPTTAAEAVIPTEYGLGAGVPQVGGTHEDA